MTTTPRRRVTSVGAATWTIAVATVAGVVATLAVAMGVFEPDPPQTGTPVTAPVTPTSAKTGDPAQEIVYLDQLSPIVGQGSRVPVPEQLAARPGYERAVAIACPSNNVGDRHVDVAYELRGNYRAFRAVLLPYREPADRVRVQVDFHREDADMKPGASPPAPVQTVQMRMGERRDYELNVSGVYKLRLHLVCELPGGMVILGQAALTAA